MMSGNLIHVDDSAVGNALLEVSWRRSRGCPRIATLSEWCDHQDVVSSRSRILPLTQRREVVLHSSSNAW